MIKLMKSFAWGALALLISGQAMAVVCTTNAGTGTWNTAGTWSCGHVPVAADTVVITRNITAVATTVAGLTVNTGSTLTLGGITLTVTGDIANSGTITNATGTGIIQSTGNAASISGTNGTFSGSARLYISGTGPSIIPATTLTFAGTTQIRAGRNGGTAVPGSVLTINGTITSTQAAGTNLLRLYATSTVIGASGIINAASSTITYNAATATLTNNGSVTVQNVTQNATTNSWTQGNNSSLTVSAASTFGTASATTGLNASATGNTVTYTSPATAITPSANTYYNLAGSGVACPTPFTILGTSPCTLPPGVLSMTRSPASCINVATLGTVAWTGLANAYASDNVYATASVARNATSNFLQCTNYGFAIPAGSTILGIVVNVERKTSNNTMRDAAMRLVKNVAGVATIQATDRSTLTNYTTADVIEMHGGSSDLWGTTWALADINTTNFGAAFAAMNVNSNTRTVSLDHMPITVYYATPSIHHIEIDHPGSGSTCASTPVAVKACGDAACNPANYYTLGATVTLAPGGNTLTIPGGSGTGTGTVASTAAGAVTLASASNPASANATTCVNTVSGVASCSFTFNSGTISLSVPDAVSGNNVTGTITPCPTGGSGFNGVTKTINFYTSYANPATGTLKATVNGTPIGTTAATSTAISLAFNASSQATFTLSYPDVGRVSLTASYAGTPALSNGTASFLMIPAGFVLSNIKQISCVPVPPATTCTPVNNPGATDASGGAFVKAGEAFGVTVTAVNSAGATTPNFGQGMPPESVKLTPTYQPGVGLVGTPPSVMRLTKGSIFSGSTALSVTNSNDYAVGDRIRIVGAGAGGADLYTAIAAIPSQGQITLATTASTSVSLGSVHYAFGPFASGVATGSNFTWDEVGIIKLKPSIADGTYQTASDVGTTMGSIAAGSNSLSVYSVAGLSVGDSLTVHGADTGNADLAAQVAGIAGLTVTLNVAAAINVKDAAVYFGLGPVGRFTLGKFGLQNVTLENRADVCQNGFLVADGVTACAPIYTYMGEQVDANFVLVPKSLSGAVVRNYVDSATAANDFAKLDPTVFADLNLAAVDRATAGGPYYLTTRISNSATPPLPVASCVNALCFQSGTADVTVPFNLIRNAAADGPYAAVQIGIVAADSDGARVEGVGATPGLCNHPNAADCYDLNTLDATTAKDHALIATTGFRYGRSKVSNAHGSELLPLVLPLAVEYWNGSSYITSADDSISVIAVGLGNYQRNLVAGMTTPAMSPIVNGLGRVGLSTPGAGHNGSVDVTVTAPTSYLPSNTGRATFGVYKGSNEFIYLREAY